MMTNTSHDFQARCTRIVRAADLFICAVGVQDMSMRRLSEMVGMSPANLYEYFESKAAIVRAVSEQVCATLEADLWQTKVGVPTHEHLVTLCTTFLRLPQGSRNRL